MRLPISDETQKILSKADIASWDKLSQSYQSKFDDFGDGRHPDKDFRCEQNYSKFFDLEKFITYHLRLVRLLDLDTSETPMNIMDIGCGAGIFLHICQYYGHRGIGIEIDSDMYRKMAHTLGVKLRVSPVLAFEKQPVDLRGFDVISAIAIKFDRLDWGPQSPEQWKIEEWKFFIEDMADRLNEGGRIFIKPNYTVKPSNDSPGYFFEDARVTDYFEKIAVVNTQTEYIISKENVMAAA